MEGKIYHKITKFSLCNSVRFQALPLWVTAPLIHSFWLEKPIPILDSYWDTWGTMSLSFFDSWWIKSVWCENIITLLSYCVISKSLPPPTYFPEPFFLRVDLLILMSFAIRRGWEFPELWRTISFFANHVFQFMPFLLHCTMNGKYEIRLYL
jgi:hypothetical protein